MDIKVELRPFIGRSVLSPPGEFIPVRFEQYVIVINDNIWAGYIGTHKGAKAMLLPSTKWTPLEVKEIERQIADIIESESVVANVAPDVPPEMLTRETDEEDEDDYDDDIDS